MTKSINRLPRLKTINILAIKTSRLCQLANNTQFSAKNPNSPSRLLAKFYPKPSTPPKPRPGGGAGLLDLSPSSAAAPFATLFPLPPKNATLGKWAILLQHFFHYLKKRHPLRWPFVNSQPAEQAAPVSPTSPRPRGSERRSCRK